MKILKPYYYNYVTNIAKEKHIVYNKNTTKEKGEKEMLVTVGAVTHTHTHTHTGNLIKEKIKHKDMIYLCDFNMFKII